MLTRRELVAALLAAPAGFTLPRQRREADDLVSLTVAQIVDRLARRGLSAADLTEAYLERIDRLNPGLNAYVTVTAERARADARAAARGPLRGVPIAHKDIFETAGILTTAGSKLYESHIPRRDAALVDRLRRAGTVLLGKGNMHELGGGVTTINPFYGTTRNPVNADRIAGGSSGGSAAAVVARLAAAATGSDTGGSVRIPAALCGCVGFKPTYGVLSTAGMLGACPTFDHAGLLTRTVEDAERLFAVLTGGIVPALRADRSWFARGLRIGVARRFFFDDVHPDVAAAIERAIGACRTLGADVRDRDLPVDAATMEHVFDPIVVAEIWQRFGGDWKTRPSAFSAGFAGFFESRPPPPTELAAAHRALRAFQEDIARVFDTLDIVLTPTVPLTAPAIAGRIDGLKILRNTWPFNAARTPAITIPCGVDREGLPIGLQLVAGRGRDRKLLQAAHACEQALVAQATNTAAAGGEIGYDSPSSVWIWRRRGAQ